MTSKKTTSQSLVSLPTLGSKPKGNNRSHEIFPQANRQQSSNKQIDTLSPQKSAKQKSYKHFRIRTEDEIDCTNIFSDTNGFASSATFARSSIQTNQIGQMSATSATNLGFFDKNALGSKPNSHNNVLQSSFLKNGAHFSLNYSINNSPAKIFIRTARHNGANTSNNNLTSATPDTSSMLNATQGSQFHFTRVKNMTTYERYVKPRQNMTENDGRDKEQDNFKKLDESDEIQIEDKKPKDLIGTDAVFQFYRHYKKLSKIVQQNDFFNIPRKQNFEITKMSFYSEIQEEVKKQNENITLFDQLIKLASIQTEMLVEAERKNLIPSKLGLVKQIGEEDILKLNHMSYGDKYTSVLSSGLKQVKLIRKYRLQDNRITAKSSAQILSTIAQKAKEVNLASNSIGTTGCENLSWSLVDNKCSIEILNVEDNKLGDYAIKKLLKGVLANKTIRILNLSKNNLTNRICEDLKVILDSNELHELYLHWNVLTAPGGQLIFDGLKTNESLKVLDLSYNTLGKGPTKSSCASSICEYITHNQELKHIDLSNNQFGLQDSTEIASALEKNKTIYGFHFQGNVGYVDSRGFLVIDESNGEDLTGMHTKVRINGCKAADHLIFRTSRDKDLRDCCWICEGWQEIVFQWKQGKSGELPNGPSDPLFIHFNFEDYRGNYFGKNNKPTIEDFTQISSYKRIVPPGDLEYFFSSDNSSEIAADQEKRFNYEGQSIPNVEVWPGYVLDVPLQKLNFQHVILNKSLFQRYTPQIGILPRTKDEVYIPPKQKRKKVKWTFPISLFAKWKGDDEELLRKCFETDWDYGKIPKIIKKEEEILQVKEFFRSNYKLIKDCYKTYATKFPVGDIWAIQNPAFLEFVEKIKIIDKNLIKDPDINLKWVATISSIPQADKTNQRNPVQAISRYQMMEVLVRIADEKYILKFKSTTSYFEAVKMFWQDHLAQEINSQYNLQTWRNERYWNEECDTCLKFYKRIIEHVYKKYSKLKVKPGQVPFMCLDELQAICTKTGLLEEAHFGPNVALQAFNFSMMPQVDELQSDRTFQMSMVEFYEALARISEAASLIPVKGLYPETEEWTLEKRKAQILGYKLEAFIVRMLGCLCDALFKEKYPPITQSFFVQEDDSDVELVSP